MEPLHNPSRDFRCIWITVCTYLPPAIWSVERELLLLLSLPPPPSSDVNSNAALEQVVPGSYAMAGQHIVLYINRVGFTGWPPSHAQFGGGALVGGCEVAMIFQSTYGVSVTSRVTPTWWVKCMFWRTLPMVDRHSSLQEKQITSTLA